MKYRYIAVEGNIGSGKTTLASKLAVYYQAQLVLEEFADNPFLPKFYKDAKRYAFPLELSFLADRYNQLKAVFQSGVLFQDIVVADYLFAKSKIFAHINLSEDEYQLFQRMADIITLNLVRPDLLIFLHCSIEKLQENIVKRGRSYEQDIPAQYLEKVQVGYEQYLKYDDVKILHVDMQKVDFNIEAHFLRLINLLEGGEAFPDANVLFG